MKVWSALRNSASCTVFEADSNNGKRIETKGVKLHLLDMFHQLCPVSKLFHAYLFQSLVRDFEKDRSVNDMINEAVCPAFELSMLKRANPGRHMSLRPTFNFLSYSQSPEPSKPCLPSVSCNVNRRLCSVQADQHSKWKDMIFSHARHDSWTRKALAIAKND
eukprot:767072-Hanusia_phi.AAC.7